MHFPWSPVVFILVACFLCNICSANDVIGCGGFVESSVSINYSPIQIRLYTNRGVLKYTSDCAPNNGYYFVPLYDNGDYVLRIEPPSGWSFDPMHVELAFDGKTDLCSKQTDINFVFKGFTITGKIFSYGSTSGPAGVKVTLKSKANNNIIKQNVTLVDGLYSFHDILPGQYVVEVSHDQWKFDQDRIIFDVIDDNVNLHDPKNAKQQINVIGYSVTGKVVSDGQAIKGVQFALFAKDGSIKASCEDESKPQYLSKLSVSPQLKYLCNTLSDVNGAFRFKNLPIGQYILYTYYQAQNIRFEVTPVKYAFEIQHDDSIIEQLFQIGGFTVFGSVSNSHSSTERIDEAVVSLIDQNGKNDLIKVDHFSSKGSFTVDNIKTSNYLIKTSAPHYQFEDIVFSISPNTPNLPIISPSKFEVCGKVKLRTFDSKYDNLHLLVNKKESNVLLQSVPIRGEEFCFFLPGDSYQLKMSGKENNLRFIPDSLNLKLNKPQLNLAFEQFTAFISGQVQLNRPMSSIEDEKLTVHLAQADSPKDVLQTADLKHISANRFQFRFDDVLPGNYVVSIAGKLVDLFCWNNAIAPITVVDADVDNVVFKQKGVYLQLSLSHSADLTIQSPSGKKINIDKGSIVPERLIRQCVEESGRYEIILKGCHKFSENEGDNFELDTNKMAGQVMSFKAVKHLVTAHVRSASNLTDLSVKVSVRSNEEHYSKSIALTQYKQIESEHDHSPLYQYTLSFYERAMTDIRLEPVSSQLLFKPAFFEFKLKNDCHQDTVTFHGRFGLFVDGLVKPNIANATINIYESDTNELVFTTSTDLEGKFAGGPFDDDIKLRIEAIKDGYLMKHIPSKFGHFEAHKLSSISTTIVDQNGNPLNDVLVSVSGGENNFRKNSVINSNGHLNFENLHPGKYFIRFMRKEYEFEPSSEMITLNSGDKYSSQVKAKKVAFSCLGTVDSLNREPEFGVVVEAVGLRNLVENSLLVCSQVQEQAVTESDGSYRILGLHPECQYAIRLKIEDNEHIRESIPRLYSVRVHNSDLTDQRFIVLYKQSQIELSLNVKTDDEFLSSLTVQLFRYDDTHLALFKQTLSTSPFVFLPSIPLDGKQYQIRIDSDLSQGLYRHSPIVHTFTANESQAHFQFEFNPKLRQSYSYASTGLIDPESDTNPLYSIPLVLLAIFFFYSRSITDTLRNLYQHKTQWMSLLSRRNSVENGNSSTKKKLKAKKVN